MLTVTRNDGGPGCVHVRVIQEFGVVSPPAPEVKGKGKEKAVEVSSSEA